MLIILLISIFIVIPNLFSNKRPPQEFSVYLNETSGDAHGVYVSGDYAYVADGWEGLAVIDVSDPTNPGTPVYENTPGDARGVYVSGDYAYVADGWEGLAVIDISDPTNLRTPVYENTPGFASGVYVSGGYAYLADIWGLVKIDFSEPIDPGTPGGAIPFELIIIASIIGGGAVIGVAVVILIRRKRK